MSVLPPAASMVFQSNLDAITNSQREYHRHHHHQRKPSRSTTTATTAPGTVFPASIDPRPFTAQILEAVFAKVLEALIFTSALAITAYNYWTGELANTATPMTAATATTTAATKAGSSHQHQRHYCYECNGLNAGGERNLDIRQWRQAHPHHRSSLPPMGRMQDQELLDDSKRRWTLQWAENVAQITATTAMEEPLSAATMSISMTSNRTSNSSSNSIRSLQRQCPPRSVSHPNMVAAAAATTTTEAAGTSTEDGLCNNAIQENGKEDEMLARMEEQLQSLIEQGQAALTSGIVDMEAMGESEMIMRKSFASG